MFSEAAVGEITRKQTSRDQKGIRPWLVGLRIDLRPRRSVCARPNISINRERSFVLIVVVQRAQLPGIAERARLFQACGFGTSEESKDHGEQRPVT